MLNAIYARGKEQETADGVANRARKQRIQREANSRCMRAFSAGTSPTFVPIITVEAAFVLGD